MDLIERLRFELRDWDGKSRFHFPEINALLINEAVSAIASLRARVAELEGHLAGALHEADWMVERVELNIHARAVIRDRLKRARTTLQHKDQTDG